MPVTTLAAVTQTRLDWSVRFAANSVAAINSNDPSTAGNPSRVTTFFAPSPTDKYVMWSWDTMPTIANGAAIDSVQVETGSRRSGGSVSGQFRVVIASTGVGGAPTYYAVTITPGAPGGTGIHVQIDIVPTAPDGTAWTLPKLDAGFYGVRNGPVAGTGVWCSYMAYLVTWRGSVPSQVVEGICWLGPLITSLPWLAGLNLYHESEEVLKKIGTIIRRELLRKEIRTSPTFGIDEEREVIMDSLFVRPAYAI